MATVEATMAVTTPKIEGQNIQQLVGHSSANTVIRAIFHTQLFGFTPGISTAVILILWLSEEGLKALEEGLVVNAKNSHNNSQCKKTSLLRGIELEDQSILSMALKRYLSRYFHQVCIRKSWLKEVDLF